MIDWQLLGNYIRNARINNQLSQDELTKRARTSNNTIWRIEEKIRPVPLELVIRICEVLEINFIDLLFICKSDNTIPDENITKEKLIKHYKLDDPLDITKNNFNWKKIREAITESRIKKGWSQKNLANYLKVDCSAVCHIERGNYRPMRMLRLKKICQVLNIDMHKLLEQYRIEK